MFCENCGQQLPENVAFCPNCGKPCSTHAQEAPKPEEPAAGAYYQENQTRQEYRAPEPDYSQPVYSAQPARPSVEYKNIATAIILSIVTCGIYGIFWVYGMVRDVNLLTGDDDTTLQFILCAFVPFYSIYWLYTRDKKLVEAGARYGVPVSDNSVIMLILVIVQLGIVSWAMLQNDLNTFANA